VTISADARENRAVRQSLLLAWPSLMIGLFFVVPFALLLEVSVGRHAAEGLWQAGFEPGNFIRMLDPVILRTLAYSIALALLVALVSTVLAFPFTYFITRMGRRAQIVWLILLLSTLSLSEVLVAFAWQVMLSKRIGLTDLLVHLGLASPSESLTPSLGAVVTCLTYLVFPYTVLLLYPALSRMDRHVIEAARMLGASPVRVFLTVIVPMMRGPILSSTILASVSTIGTFVTPSVLGRPEHWTIAILIGKAALTGGDLPLAAALSILLLSVTLGLTGLTMLIGGGRRAA
jgi:putative spermidine/putrescine transport system permease protein